VAVTVGEYTVIVDVEPPALLGLYRQHAELVDDFDVSDDWAVPGYCFMAVGDGGDWPHLVVTQRFSPTQPGFSPGVLLVPDAGQLFIGAGTRLLGYHRRSGRWPRTWTDEAEPGFWQWRQHGDVVLMSAELEFAAWTTSGQKLWTTFVEPPWSYKVTGDQVRLGVMGTITTFDKSHGPHRRHETGL
jgi:hypothetical protein